MTKPTKRQWTLVKMQSWECLSDYKTTRDEIRKAKEICRGHYSDDWWDYTFVALTPSGKRRYFNYNDNDKKRVKGWAKLWAQGKTKDVMLQEDLYSQYKDILGRYHRYFKLIEEIKGRLTSIFRGFNDRQVQF